MIEKLLRIHNRRKSIEKEIKEKREIFEESIALERATLNDLQDEEDKLREEVLARLEVDNKDSIESGNKIIIRQIKETRKVVNPDALSEALSDLKIIEPLGYKLEDFYETIEKVTNIKNKKLVDEIINKYEQIEGKLLDGVEIQRTKYLTIRDK